jgi:hypothetical protein
MSGSLYLLKMPGNQFLKSDQRGLRAEAGDYPVGFDGRKVDGSFQGRTEQGKLPRTQGRPVAPRPSWEQQATRRNLANRA